MKIFELINRAVKDRTIKHSDFRILLCLVSYNSNRRIFPSLTTISKDTGIKSIPDISKGVNRLCKAGYIKIKRRKHQSNIYELIPGAVRQKSAKAVIETKEGYQKSDNPEDYIAQAYIDLIAITIAEYRNETEPKGQIYKFINKLINSYSDNTTKKYQIAFLLLCEILKHKDKFTSGLPYNYFNSFFGMLIYADFRKKVFDDSIKEIELQNFEKENYKRNQLAKY